MSDRHLDYVMDWRAPKRCEHIELPVVEISESKDYEAGVRAGWGWATAFYSIGSAVLVLTFHILGAHP